ncbi:hypothetical protein AGMMS49546_03630 [Spirochaetia bacterium]|nr:hypothetical protein AGMMS49546_03630 [Spirochaetia bacterium]
MHETSTNQAQLEYYTDNASRIKYASSNHEEYYWTVSPYPVNTAVFCSIDNAGNAGPLNAGSPAGCAPAFCVK